MSFLSNDDDKFWFCFESHTLKTKHLQIVKKIKLNSSTNQDKKIILIEINCMHCIKKTNARHVSI